MAFDNKCGNDPCVCPDEEELVELTVTIDKKTREAIKRYAGSGGTVEKQAARILIEHVRLRDQGGGDLAYLGR